MRLLDQCVLIGAYALIGSVCASRWVCALLIGAHALIGSMC